MLDPRIMIIGQMALFGLGAVGAFLVGLRALLSANDRVISHGLIVSLSCFVSACCAIGFVSAASEIVGRS